MGEQRRGEARGDEGRRNNTYARTRTLAYTHPCTHAHTYSYTYCTRPDGRARQVQAMESTTARTLRRAGASGDKARAHIARPCLARVRRSEVGDEGRNARLCQGDTRQRRVVPLRRTEIIFRPIPSWVAAHMEAPVQRRHTKRHVSTTHRLFPCMAPATSPEAGLRDRITLMRAGACSHTRE
jgi:hypothetical protein